ncbi:CiaD-like domain-containing protein [Sulfurimonas sp.]|uniref:CiaD-like domain-containing protein n=1 Tax=Sulfurimonas sp. TaxID=2022749 RepID=UPI002B4AA477|nr:hypothetical protein [Sulfurimonas sp.]
MELKDAILSTLAEMEDNEITKKVLSSSIKAKKNKQTQVIEVKLKPKIIEETAASMDGEKFFLNSMKERLLVLFEGFQAPNNKKIEAKLDMTLNFLEYALATIEQREQELKKGKRK